MDSLGLSTMHARLIKLPARKLEEFLDDIRPILSQTIVYELVRDILFYIGDFANGVLSKVKVNVHVVEVPVGPWHPWINSHVEQR